MPKSGKVRSPSLTSQESYSAIIIADLVAEVQQQPVTNKHILSQVREKSHEDDYDSKASNNSADDYQIDVKSNFTNGSNISKGVILNATKFGQADVLSKTGKDIPTLQLQETDGAEGEKDPDFKSEINQMSSLRKIAFGFSFLPSIMFIVCFAVIFPCEKVLPCTKEAWTITLNHTEVTSSLKVAQNVFFAFLIDAESGLRSINEASGETVWNTFTSSPSLYTECGNLAQPDRPSCFVMDSNGTLSLFDQSNGKMLWQINSKGSETPSFPAILPDCDNDSIDEIAVAVSSSKMKIISLGIEFFIDVPECDSTPSNILAWKKKSGSDLILSCQKGQNDILLKIPQNKWCKYNNTNLEQISILISTKSRISSQSKLSHSPEGLTLWSEDTVTMFDSEGRIKWTVSDLNHSQQNRFLFHGKVNKDNSQVILYSSNLLDNFQVTMLNFENGNITLSKAIANMEISDTVLILNEKYDFALSLRKKLTKSFKSEAEVQISTMPASLMNLLTGDDLIKNLNTTSKIVEELILMKLDGSVIQTLQAFDDTEGQSYSTLFTAVLRENKDLDVYVLRKTRGKKYSTLKRISVSKWDASSAHCTGK